MPDSSVFEFMTKRFLDCCVTHNGKRLGLMRLEEQEAWVDRKAMQHGFSLPQHAIADISDTSPVRVDVRIAQGQTLRGKQHTGNGIRVFSVLYDGILVVTNPSVI